MEAPASTTIQAYVVQDGYLCDHDELLNKLTDPEAEHATFGKMVDVFVTQQPFEIKNVAYLEEENKARVTVAYNGNENDRFTAIAIGSYILPEGTQNYSGKTYTMLGQEVSAERCVLFRNKADTAEKVDSVTRDIFVKLIGKGKPEFSPFRFDNVVDVQHIIGRMTLSDKLLLLPKLHWHSLCSWFSGT